MIPKKTNNNKSPRVRVIQKLYSNLINPDEKITYAKSQFKKFIKDVTEGTIERKDLIEETIIKHLKNDIDFEKPPPATELGMKYLILIQYFSSLFKTYGIVITLFVLCPIVLKNVTLLELFCLIYM